MSAQQLEIWNFVCRFGEDGVLLDHYEDLVEPAFLGGHERRWGETRYLLHAVQYINAGSAKKPLPALAGRIVKDTVIHQQQKLVAGELVPADGSLPSAPSSLFVLLLTNHRLLFVREHQGSPDARQFASTIERFVRTERTKFVQRKHKEAKEAGETVTKSFLQRSIALPEVTVTPVLMPSAVEQFVQQFARIRSVIVEIAPTNDEPDNEEFFRVLRATGHAIGAKRSRVEYVAPPKEGLDSATTLQQVKAAQNGQATFKISGEDKAGNRLTGDNEQLRVRVPLASDNEELSQRASDAADQYRELVEAGSISSGGGEARQHATILGLAARLFRSR
ncbi:MAG TPA: hypothetical protein VFZ65_04025 [Planctomycetota bacterium]|nr:hypothetical protein [Planctomycetota bacterium]